LTSAGGVVDNLGWVIPPDLSRQGAKPLSGGFCSFSGFLVRTHVYIDGFNLYYGAVKGTPYRWLDVARLCTLLLPRHSITAIRYFTARVKGTPSDPDQTIRQEVYLRALRTLPGLTIHFGHFLQHPVSMPLAGNPSQRVRVLKTEEKGSDVNLASHLLNDAHMGRFEAAVIVSNDSDLCEPIRIVKDELGLGVGVLCPHQGQPKRRGRPSVMLRRLATFFKPIRASVLQASQFSASLSDMNGAFHKPVVW
jgi:uncharacterized LabA/DUF88 family protein